MRKWEDGVIEGEEDEVLLFRRRTGVEEDRFSLLIVATTHDSLEMSGSVDMGVIPFVFVRSLFGRRYEI